MLFKQTNWFFGTVPTHPGRPLQPNACSIWGDEAAVLSLCRIVSFSSYPRFVSALSADSVRVEVCLRLIILDPVDFGLRWIYLDSDDAHGLWSICGPFLAFSFAWSSASCGLHQQLPGHCFYKLLCLNKFALRGRLRGGNDLCSQHVADGCRRKKASTPQGFDCIFSIGMYL